MPADAKTILLVEDEALMAITGKMVLEQNGFKVLIAKSGEAAVEIAESQAEIDIILMDINLGSGMDGIEAARLILQKRDLPLIFHSSHTERETMAKAEGITSYGYIVKNSGETVMIASIKMAFRLFEAKKKEAEIRKELIHSRDLMSYIIEHSQSAIAVHDRELRYLFVSQRYLEEYRVAEKDIIGRHHYEIFPDLPQKWREVHQRALAGEISSAEDDPYERADGSVEWTRWECRPWYETDGTIGGIIVYAEIITDKKRIEENLRKSEQKCRAITLAAREGYFAAGLDGRIREVNPAYCAMSGYAEDEILGLGLEDIEAEASAEDSARRIKRMMEKGSEVFGSKHRRKDGSIFAVEVSAQYLPIDGGLFVCFCRDSGRNMLGD